MFCHRLLHLFTDTRTVIDGTDTKIDWTRRPPAGADHPLVSRGSAQHPCFDPGTAKAKDQMAGFLRTAAPLRYGLDQKIGPPRPTNPPQTSQ
jgi:hypothetical protein